MAKAPVAGRVKTRLVPPYTFEEAATLAEAALRDTLAAALACGADEVVVVLDGAPGDWLPSGCRVVPQRGDGLDERLANAWDDVGGPGVQIGMDSPQVVAADLDAAIASLDDHDAVLGLAADGGWWAVGLRRADERVFLGVPMSRPDTGDRQLDRLQTLGLSVGMLRVLQDVDGAGDVTTVADTIPGSRFARAAAGMRATRG